MEKYDRPKNKAKTGKILEESENDLHQSSPQDRFMQQLLKKNESLETIRPKKIIQDWIIRYGPPILS